MAGKIKGITIEIDGETKGLQKALTDVNKQSRSLQTELSSVNRSLKFNPGNAELLAQKQKLLGDQVATTKNKLSALKQAQSEVQAQFERGEIGERQYRAFQREIIETESKLKHFEEQLKSSQNKLQQFGQSVSETGEKLKKVGDDVTSVGKNLTAKVTTPLLAVGTIAAKVGSDFEAGMSKVQAISGASGEDLVKLTEKAREMGATTQFSATEAADGLSYMAMAGWKTEDMLNGIEGIMSLAAASGEDLGMVSDIVTDALTAFGLQAKDSGRFADVLAAASSNANTNVAMLGNSFEYVAPVAGALGFSVEDVSLALGLMANSGIKADKSGTALRTMMTNLVKPTKEMQGEMDNLGISMTDSEGNMKTFDTVMQELRGSFDGLSEAEQASAAATIFGKEAMSGALAIINSSAEDYNKLSDAINGSEGAAQKMAEVVNDNLQGRLKEMKSALEEAAISIYDNLQPALESLVSFIKQVADWFNQLSPAAQNLVFIFGVVAAAIGPVLIIIGTLISAIGSIMTVIGPVITAIGSMGGVIALLTNPITLVIAAVAALIAIFVALYQNNEEFRTKVQEIWASIQENFQIALTFISELVHTIMTAVTSFFGEQLAAISAFWDTNGKQIMDLVSLYFSAIWSHIKMVMGLIKGIFQVVWPLISAIVKTAWASIKFVVDTAINAVLGIIQTVMQLLQGDWEGAWNTIEDTAETIMDNIIGFFKEIDLLQVGKDIIQGLINGITSMIGSVKTAVSGMAEKIPTWAKKILGIASPSKVFAQIGEWTGEGLVQGMDATAYQIQRASDRMAETAVPNVPSVNSRPQGGGNNGGGSDNVTNINLEGLFKGAIFNVREEQDIQKIAKALNDYIKQGARKGGVVMP